MVNNSKADWNRPGPPMLPAPVADACLLRLLRERDKVAQGRHAWLSCLLRSGKLVVRRQATAQWLFALGDACSTVGLLSPAKHTVKDGKDVVTPLLDTDGLAEAFVMEEFTTPKDWEAATTNAISPFRVALKAWRSKASIERADVGKIEFVCASKARPLMEVVALNGFDDLPLSTLQVRRPTSRPTR